MPQYVQITFPAFPYFTLTYKVTSDIQNYLQIGHRVSVPLGKRHAMGIATEFIQSSDVDKIKPINAILDTEPVFNKELLDLAKWISQYYLASLGEVLRCMLPTALIQKSDSYIRLKDSSDQWDDLNNEQTELVQLLQKKTCIPVSKLYQNKSLSINRTLLKSMEEKGIIEIQLGLKSQKATIQKEAWLILNNIPSENELDNLRRRAKVQAALLESMIKSNQSIKRSQCSPSAAKGLLEKGYLQLEWKEVLRDMYGHVGQKEIKPITLTDEQKEALRQIKAPIEKKSFNVFLLYGITGSGKTQVYIESIKKTLKNHGSVIVLIPEISLTPQAVQRYRSKFGDQVAVLHSRMSDGERFDSWRKLKSGKSKIALGPRSAIFAPLDDLGLIIVDEEQDSSYKQMDPAPRYHARDVAIMRGKLENAPVILGSATPGLESYNNALEGKYTLCTLKHRIDHVPLPKVDLVSKQADDQKLTAKKLEIYRVLSPALLQKIEARLQKKEQIILLQNRRGFSTFLRCYACGHVEHCPNCDITLTFHQHQRLLRCHYCGFEKSAPDTCPSCDGNTLSYRGIGTQKVEEGLQKRYPEVKIVRMDLDTTQKKGAHDKIVTLFEKGEADILLGTQMVAKGHDFQNVQLVGIISADTEIHFPDFRAGEKTFQLLTQAAGRAGRRDEQGEVMVQTSIPDHPVLQFSKQHDYENFYQWEVKQRQSLFYPPWGRIILIRFKSESEIKTQEAARFFTGCITRSDQFIMLGPVPSPLSRIKNNYRFQLILRSSKTKDPSGKIIRDVARKAIIKYQQENKYPQVRIAIDVDPQDMM